MPSRFNNNTTDRTCPPDLPPRLVSNGAVLSRTGDGGQPMLVGEWTPLDDRRVFVFPAHGDAGDEQVIEFDETVLLDTQIVGLMRSGCLVAQLAAINAAGMADPDDYRVAWQIWQQVAPMVRDHIARLRARVDAERDE